MTVPSDASLQAALYGTQHGETIIGLDKADRVLEILIKRQLDLLDDLTDAELQLAIDVLDVVPELIVAAPETADAPDWAAAMIDQLRLIERYSLAIDMVTSWRESIAKRGSYYGVTEHGVRINANGRADEIIKAALTRWRTP